ncbi:MAG: hypothetical protein H6644_08540 [Caldilineaceae bacterium]|nr:hypothetical protein [Caldilineaceae bacterium]
MRILIVTLFFRWRATPAPRTTRSASPLALQARGHDVQVVCAEDWEDGATYWNGVTQDRVQGVTVNRVHLNWARAQNPNRVLYTSPQVDRWFADFLAATCRTWCTSRRRRRWGWACCMPCGGPAFPWCSP